MSYDGEYDGNEYPDGINAPCGGWRGSRELAAKDAEIERLRATLREAEKPAESGGASPMREQIVESVLVSHLPIPLSDGSVMCMCHADQTQPPAIFEGPVYHRRHVAGLVIEWLGRGTLHPHLYEDLT